jgi:hypothetical protein
LTERTAAEAVMSLSQYSLDHHTHTTWFVHPVKAASPSEAGRRPSARNPIRHPIALQMGMLWDVDLGTGNRDIDPHVGLVGVGYG